MHASGTANGGQHGAICVGGLKSFGGVIAAVQILKGDRTQNDTLRVVKKIALGALRWPGPQGSFTDIMSPDSSWTFRHVSGAHVREAVDNLREVGGTTLHGDGCTLPGSGCARKLPLLPTTAYHTMSTS